MRVSVASEASQRTLTIPLDVFPDVGSDVVAGFDWRLDRGELGLQHVAQRVEEDELVLDLVGVRILDDLAQAGEQRGRADAIAADGVDGLRLGEPEHNNVLGVVLDREAVACAE